MVPGHLHELDDKGLPVGEWCEEYDHVLAFCYKGFEQSMEGLIPGACYDSAEAQERYEFRAGSYSGYGQWRDELADYAEMSSSLYSGSHDKYRDYPFFELVFFADNEGCIGPVAAGRLHIAFTIQRATYSVGRDEYDLLLYDHWTKACGLASRNGLISFH